MYIEFHKKTIIIHHPTLKNSVDSRHCSIQNCYDSKNVDIKKIEKRSMPRLNSSNNQKKREEKKSQSSLNNLIFGATQEVDFQKV